MSKGFTSKFRMALLIAVVLACFGMVTRKLVYLHIIDRDELVSKAYKARLVTDTEKARRGDILDSHGDTLAISRGVIKLTIDPFMLKAKDAPKLPELAQILGKPLSEIRLLCTPTRSEVKPAKGQKPSAANAETDDDDNNAAANVPNTPLTKPNHYVVLAKEIDEDTFSKIEKLKIPGVRGERSYIRIYPRNQLAAHLIGFVNKEEQPSSGIEAYANMYLRSCDGWLESEQDSRQSELAQFRTREVPARNGYTVKLSIDSVIQNWAENELAELAHKYSPQNATIIISDAKTGFLLALANYPTFNLNEYGKADKDAFRNYAISNLIDPGSTFKIVAASAALNDNIVTPATNFDCSAEFIDYRGKPLRLVPDDHHWDHALSVAEIISHSSNRGAAQLAIRVGEQRFYEYIKAFGFTARTGFPFGGETSGLLLDPSKWQGVDIARIPAGYSVSATPIQIHYAMASIASGGNLLTPQIISEVRDANGDPVFQFQTDKPKIKHQVISPATAATMSRLLQGVVSPDGTAGKIFIPGYQLAGKTGTAQKYIPKNEETGAPAHYSKTEHVGSFSGFFPASRPRVVITVIVDGAKLPTGGAAYGSTVAAPSFKHLAEKLISYLNIEPVSDTAPALQRQSALVAR